MNWKTAANISGYSPELGTRKMQFKLSREEIWPSYTVLSVEGDDVGHAIELTDDEYSEWQRVLGEFNKWQDRFHEVWKTDDK